MTEEDINNVNEEIEALSVELNRLTIEQSEIEIRKTEIQQQIRALRRTQAASSGDDVQAIPAVAVESTSRVSERPRSPVGKRLPYWNLNYVENRVDRDGNTLRQDDEVEYLTQGRQQSETGVITGFGKRFVETEDDFRNVVRKEPQNLRKVN